MDLRWAAADVPADQLASAYRNYLSQMDPLLSRFVVAWQRVMQPATLEAPFDRLSSQLCESLAAHLDLIKFESAQK